MLHSAAACPPPSLFVPTLPFTGQGCAPSCPRHLSSARPLQVLLKKQSYGHAYPEANAALALGLAAAFLLDNVFQAMHRLANGAKLCSPK